MCCRSVFPEVRRRAAQIVAVVLVWQLAAAAHAAETGQSILEKCQAHYDTARTLEGTYYTVSELPQDRDMLFCKTTFTMEHDAHWHAIRYNVLTWTQRANTNSVLDPGWISRMVRTSDRTPPSERAIYSEAGAYFIGLSAKQVSRHPRGDWASPTDFPFRDFGLDRTLPTDEGILLHPHPKIDWSVQEIRDGGKRAFLLESRTSPMVRIVIDQSTFELKRMEARNSRAIFHLVFRSQHSDRPIAKQTYAWKPPADYTFIDQQPYQGPIPY